MNETKTMYHAVPVVSELNRVKGFDPTRFLRKTKDGPKLDLSVKKLWFRLKYPNGRIKLSALKITDQLAIIEARVFFDKNDTQPVSSFTAQTNNQTTPGGLYNTMPLTNHFPLQDLVFSLSLQMSRADLSYRKARYPRVRKCRLSSH